MEAFQLAVTEVTIFGSLRCVAGFDVDRNAMVRPEPAPNCFWRALMCGENTTFHPGHLVRFSATKPSTEFPHNTEDWVVNGEPRFVKKLNAAEFESVLRKTEPINVANTFRGHLKFSRLKAYVEPGADCGSLCSLMISAGDLTFTVDQWDGKQKLRANAKIEGRQVDLSVSAKDLRQAFDKGGLGAVNGRLKNASRLHVRLGLARADMEKGLTHCYLQVNGVYPISG